MAEGRDAGPSMRLDRFLWWSRLSATRSYAQALAEAGHLRIDGRRVERAAAPVRVGNVLAFVSHTGAVRIVRIEALPARRGPPAEGRACYTDLKNENVSQKDPID